MPTTVSRRDPVLDALRWTPGARGSAPLYVQLKRALLDLIERGEIRHGQRIPSERQLAQHLGISRMTVRQALVELVQESVLVRRQGRGTFVAERKIEQGLVSLTSFSEDMRRRGMRPGARLLDMEVQEAPPKVEKALGLDGDRRVLVIRRLRLADGIPMALETSHLPIARVPSVPRRRVVEGSLYEYLQGELGIDLARAHQTLEPVLAGESEARLLGVEPGSPLLLMERTTYDATGEPVEFVRSLYRGDRYKFFVELRRDRLVRGESL
ncbi:MAG TPA: GntR family transcriptional regulator [Limnochordales bacterium]